MDRLRASLTATGQAGKNINRVQFDPAANQAELRTLTRIRQELEAIARTKQGRQWRSSVIGSGQDWNRPWSWDYGRMGSNGASLQRRMAEGSPSGGSGWQSMGSWGMGQARQGIGTMASLAGIGSMIGAVMTGYREHLATLEGVDTVFKSIGSSGGFAGLMDDTRALGKALQMTGSEASHLIQRFAQASGAVSASSAFGQAQFAGQLGRGMGMGPNASADLMARSSLVGYGSTKASQRDFAATIGQTIAGSGMQARSEQVMGALVAQIEKIATTQGRTAMPGEVSNYADMLRTMLKDPALRGGGLGTIMGIGSQLGGDGGPMADALASLAYGPAVDNRIDDILRIQQADEDTPLNRIRGLGPVAEGYGDKTRRELAMGAADRFGDGMPGGTSYVMSKLMGIGTMQQVDVYRENLNEMLRQKEVRKTGGYQDWMKGTVGTGHQDASPSGFGITTDIYENRGKLDKAHLERLTGLANEYSRGNLLDGDENKDLKAELKKAMEDGGTAEEKMPQLQLAIAKIAARVGAPKTKADETRQSAADLVNLLGDLGDAVGTSVNALRDFATTILGITLPDRGVAQSSEQAMDDYTWGKFKENGYLNSEGNRTDKAFPNQYEEDAYQRVLGRRQRGYGGTPGAGAGGGAWSPSWGAQMPDSGAPGAGGTPDSGATASAGVTPGRNHLLNMIAGPESGGNYNAMYKAANQTDHDLTGMTMDEIDALQTKMIDERGGSAIGKYQYLRKTLRGLRSDMGIGGDEKFDKPMQDRLALESLRRRGLEGWEAGTMPDAEFQAGIAQEWAGVPIDASGRSAHEGVNGNRARIPHSRVMAAFAAARAANQSPVTPDVPTTVASESTAPSAPAETTASTAPAAPAETTPAAPDVPADIPPTPEAPTEATAATAPEAPAEASAATVPEAPAEATASAVPEVPAAPAAPAAPAETTAATAPASPVADPPSGATSASGRTTTGFNGRETQHWMPDPNDPRYSTDNIARLAREGNITTDEAWRRQEDADRAARAPKAPPVPTEAATNINGPTTTANVNGQVGININVARDGRPVESSAHQLAFRGEPNIYGSGGSQQNRVEWSRTV